MSNEKKNELLVRKIRGFLGESGYTKPELAACLGFGYTTLLNKMENPDTFNYRELRELFRIMKLPEELKLQLM